MSFEPQQPARYGRVCSVLMALLAGLSLFPSPVYAHGMNISEIGPPVITARYLSLCVLLAGGFVASIEECRDGRTRVAGNGPDYSHQAQAPPACHRNQASALGRTARTQEGGRWVNDSRLAVLACYSYWPLSLPIRQTPLPTVRLPTNRF